MGWEIRDDGRRYLYRNRRVNGKPVKEYLAADDRFGFGALMAHDLMRVQKREAKLRALTRKVQREYRERIDGLLRAVVATNTDLLARRVVNGWIATHALELELTVRPPTDARSKEHLDRALTRAQKRMTEAVGELARVRRLQAPRVLAQLNLLTSPAMLNAAPAPPALTAGSPGQPAQSRTL